MVLYINHDKEIEDRINEELESCEMPYKLKDSNGNAFTYRYMENGFPVYRGKGGSCHILDAQGYKVVQQNYKPTINQ